MKHAEKLFFGFLLIGVIFLSGCVGQPKTTPNIVNVQPSKNFMYTSDTVDILITANNPTQINFLGKVLLQVDNNNCFNVYPISNSPSITGLTKDISINAQQSNSVVITLGTPYNLVNDCYGVHKLTIFLVQNVTTTFDVKTIDFSLVSR